MPAHLPPPKQTAVLAVLAGAIGLGVLVSAAQAQPAQEASDCVQGGSPKVELACTTIIEQGNRSPQELANAHARRGASYRVQRKLDQAFADFAEALRLDPDSWEGHLERGLGYRDKGQLDDALADYDRAIAIDPRRPAAFIERGWIMMLRHDNEQALKEYDHAGWSCGRISGSRIWRAARSLLRIGDHDRAMADLQSRGRAELDQSGVVLRSRQCVPSHG